MNNSLFPSGLDRRAVLNWDVYNWGEVLPLWNDRLRMLDRQNTTVLALGEREGGLSLWLASQGFDVICTDYGGIREETIAHHRALGFARRIHYADVDVFAIPYDDQRFDVVICKSVIGGLKLEHKNPSTRTLENQRLAVNEIHRVLKPNGMFLGAENMKGSRLLHALRNPWKRNRLGWRHLTTDEIRFLFASFVSIETRCFGVIPGLFKSDLLNRGTYVLNTLVNRFVPDDAKYICGVVAVR